jgi:uncharacterized protein (TIGR02301 family)
MDELNPSDAASGPTPPSIPSRQGEAGAGTLRLCPSSPSPLWGAIKGGGSGLRGWFGGVALALLLGSPAQAIDPLYQRQMERLTEIMGSLYFLEPLCETGTEDWRNQAAELIELDEPDEDRRQRLAGAFNAGYTAFSRFHRHCTPASREALARLLTEAQRLARDIHTRFAE